MDQANTEITNQRVLIGVGVAGSSMAKIMLEQGLPCAEHLYISSAEWIESVSDNDRIYLSFEDDDPRTADEIRKMLGRPQRAKIKEKLAGMETVIITVGLGGMTGGYSALIISDMAIEQEQSVVVLATMPFQFESRERQMYAEGQLQLLRKKLRVMVIPNDIIPALSPAGKNLEDAFENLGTGLGLFMHQLCSA